jgi:hypothetical protein
VRPRSKALTLQAVLTNNDQKKTSELVSNGNVIVALKTPYDDGTSHVVLSPMEFMGRLAALAWPAASKAENEPDKVSW